MRKFPYLCDATNKNIVLCRFVKCRAATNGAKPAKSIQQKPKRNNRPAPFMRPGIVKSHNKAKRNREFRQSPNFPYLCGVFLPHRIAYIGILTTPPGFVRAGFFHHSTVVRIPRPYLLRQFRPILAHIIVHVQFPVKSGF